MTVLEHRLFHIRRILRLGIALAVLSLIPAAAVRANVTFSLNNLDGAGEGFNDPVLGAARISAFNQALNIWSQLLGNSYGGETITVNANFDPLGGSAVAAPLGNAGSTLIHANFGGAAQPNTWYGSPLANHLNGSDLSASAEISATFNSDVDGGVVLGSNVWYYGSDANPPPGDIDFATVVLHEIGHGLNFFDLITPPGDPGTPGSFPSGLPGIYDRFLVNASVGGTALTSMTDAQRATAVVNDLFWSGANGVAGNGGARPEMYAPSVYEPGSSVSHLDETVHGGELMSPFYSGPDHTLSPLELGMFEDMGWEIVPEPSSLFLMASAGLIALVWLGGKRRRVLG